MNKKVITPMKQIQRSSASKEKTFLSERQQEIRRLLLEKQRGTACLDPRIKVLFIVGVSTLSLTTGGELTLLFLILSVFLLLAGGGCLWNGIKFIIAYVGFNLVITFISALDVPGLASLVEVFGFTIIKFIPVFMLAKWFSSTTRVGEFISSLERMHMPKTVTIPMAVMLRYIPTLKQEFVFIKDTMHMRGIDYSFLGFLKQPLRLMEYVLIPLLMRSLKVADELSASIMTRGIEHHGQRGSLHNIRLTWEDGFAVIVFVLLLSLLWIFDCSELAHFAIWEVIF